MRVWKPWRSVGLGLIVAFTVACASVSQRQPAVQISADERAALARIALGDSRVRGAVGEGPQRIAASDLVPDKAQAEQVLAGTSTANLARQALILIYNPTTNRAARTLIDLDRGAVLS